MKSICVTLALALRWFNPLVLTRLDAAIFDFAFFIHSMMFSVVFAGRCASASHYEKAIHSRPRLLTPCSRYAHTLLAAGQGSQREQWESERLVLFQENKIKKSAGNFFWFSTRRVRKMHARPQLNNSSLMKTWKDCICRKQTTSGISIFVAGVNLRHFVH